ncbi:hypothetical protein D3C87_1833090 [compost metagenome]
MDSAIPGDVHEADQLFRPTRADPTQAVPVDLCPPVVLEHPMFEAFGMERVDFSAFEHPPPFQNGVGEARSFR